MFALIGIFAIVIGALLISPPVLAALWSLQTKFRRAGGVMLTRTAAFDERLMTVAIALALAGVALVIVGLTRVG